MLLFFILFAFYILHINFLLKNIVFGVYESTFFHWTITYLFDRDVALQSLWFTLLNIASFVFFYKLIYRAKDRSLQNLEIDLTRCRAELIVINIMGIVMISYVLVVGGIAGFTYGRMTEIRENYGFVFETRIIFLILLSHLLLNMPWKQFWSRMELRSVRWIVVLYCLALLLFQARSPLFELALVIIFPQLMWSGDKLKYKYVLVAVGMLIVPNIIILGRIGIPEDPYKLINGLFSIEYDLLTNQFLGAAIQSGYGAKDGLSFLPQIGLVIPSPLRNLFGIATVDFDLLVELSKIAGITSGGFSLLSQMYSDFGWFSPIVFGLLGLLIGSVNARAAQVGRVKLTYAIAPLLYSMFLLSLRNDFGVFIKYAIQLFIISFVLSLFLRSRFHKMQRKAELSLAGQSHLPSVSR